MMQDKLQACNSPENDTLGGRVPHMRSLPGFSISRDRAGRPLHAGGMLPDRSLRSMRLRHMQGRVSVVGNLTEEYAESSCDEMSAHGIQVYQGIS